MSGNQIDCFGKDAEIWGLICEGHCQCVRLLLDVGAKIHETDTVGSNALHMILNQREDKIRDNLRIRLLDLLFEASIDVDAVDKNGHTPLIEYLSHGVTKDMAEVGENYI